MPLELTFLGSNRPEKKRRRVAMEVEPDEPAAGSYVLLAHRTEQRALAAARLAQHGDVHGSPRRAQRGRLARDRFIGDLKSKRQARGFGLGLSPLIAKAVPDGTEEMFEEVSHCELILQRGTTKSVTSATALADVALNLKELFSKFL